MKQAPGPELELLLQCARFQIEPDRAHRISALLDAPLDWEALTRITQRHGLIALLHRSLRAVAPEKVPARTLSVLRSMVEGHRIRNLLMVSELIRAMRALQAAGIAVTPYKGPALAACLYGDVSLRQFGDLDILVRPGDAAHARPVLVALGYVPTRHVSSRMTAAFVWLHGNFDFILAEQVRLELNWRVVPRYWRMPEIPEAAWRGIGRLSVVGVELPWFAPEYVLYLLCLHGSKHKWDTLKWIVDVAEMLRAHPEIDWDKVRNIADLTGSVPMFALGLALARDMLDAHLPAAALELVGRRRATAELVAEVRGALCAVDSGYSDTLTELAFNARLADRLQTKLFCRALLVPYFLLHRVIRPCVAALLRKTPSGR